MAKKSKTAITGDDAALNMTPMIDMTFLLVVFFMLTIDLTSKEFVPVELPFAYKGIEDSPENSDETVPRLVINLEANGTITFKSQRFSLSSEDKVAQSNALKALTQELRLLTRDPRYKEEDDSSMIPVMIHADRGAKWQYVQWIMQVCVDPGVQIYKLQFAVKKPVSEEDQ